MKVIAIILSCFFISEISAYTFTRIQGINATVERVSFDKQGNTFAASRAHLPDESTLFQIHKLNPNGELLWTIDLPNYIDHVNGLFINSQNDIYFYFYHNNYRNYTLAVLSEGATTIKEIDRLWWPIFFHDDNENLFYCKENSGMHILRPNSSGPVPITNLEGACTIQSEVFAVDQSGNIYLQIVSLERQNISIAMISNEALQDEIPQATFINAFDNSQQVSTHMTVDESNNLWISVSETQREILKKGFIRKLVNGEIKNIFIDQDFWISKMVPAKNNIFVIAAYNSTLSIYYITLNDELVEIPELKNLSDASFYFTVGIADSEGYAYFTGSEFSPSLGTMILIRPYDMTPVRIEVDSYFPPDSIKLDFKEDVWITDFSGIYHLENGGTVSDLVIPDRNEICDLSLFSDIKVNFVTKTFYLPCENGMLIVNEN